MAGVLLIYDVKPPQLILDRYRLTSYTGDFDLLPADRRRPCPGRFCRARRRRGSRRTGGIRPAVGLWPGPRQSRCSRALVGDTAARRRQRLWAERCLDHEDAKGTKSTKHEEHEGVRCRAHFLRVFALRVLRGLSCLRDPNTRLIHLILQRGP
jgi:hypothetical protein